MAQTNHIDETSKRSENWATKKCMPKEPASAVTPITLGCVNSWIKFPWT